MEYNGVTLEHIIEHFHGMPCFLSKRHASLLFFFQLHVSDFGEVPVKTHTFSGGDRAWEGQA